MLTTSSWISLLIPLLSPCFTSFVIHWQNPSIKFTPRALPNRLTPPQPSTISDNTLVDIGDNRKRKELSPACGGAETDKALGSRKVASSISCSLRDISYKLKSEITNWFWHCWMPPSWTARSGMTAIQIDTRNSAWQHRQRTASSSYAPVASFYCSHQRPEARFLLDWNQQQSFNHSILQIHQLCSDCN